MRPAGAITPHPESNNDGVVVLILLTRMNGQAFVVNAEKIRYVEATPDTVVCCDSGDRLMVRESLQEVIQKAIEYARVIRKPITA